MSYTIQNIGNHNNVAQTLVDTIFGSGRYAKTAERLRVRTDYVYELVKKQRLTFIHGEQLDAAGAR